VYLFNFEFLLNIFSQSVTVSHQSAFICPVNTYNQNCDTR